MYITLGDASRGEERVELAPPIVPSPSIDHTLCFLFFPFNRKMMMMVMMMMMMLMMMTMMKV